MYIKRKEVKITRRKKKRRAQTKRMAILDSPELGVQSASVEVHRSIACDKKEHKILPDVELSI